MTRFALAGALALSLFGAALHADDSPRTFQGNWTNRKTRSNGTMKCVGKPGEGGTWNATFSGSFQGSPFSYEVTFQAKSDRGQSALSGKAVIQNRKYEWAGALKGDTLTGRYRADNGWFGDFVLKESKGR